MMDLSLVGNKKFKTVITEMLSKRMDLWSGRLGPVLDTHHIIELEKEHPLSAKSFIAPDIELE